MYVRLAFAVAAHLDPDILIVDEVLAVGDVEFQKKCLNKMGEVKREGITVLFVSHNISAVKSFTDRCVLLSRGQLQMIAPTEPVISAYLNESSQSEAETVDFSASRGNHSRIRLARVSQENQTGDTVLAGQPFRVDVEVETDGTIDLSLTMFLRDQSGTKIGISCIYQFCGLKFPRTAGIHLCSVMLAPPWLASGTYSLDIATSRPNIDWDHYVESATRFHIPFSNPLNRSFEFRQSDDFGSIAIPFADTPTFKLSSTESSA
jgi:lipopolysaccharide transport system ATP-binding protein